MAVFGAAALAKRYLNLDINNPEDAIFGIGHDGRCWALNIPQSPGFFQVLVRLLGYLCSQQKWKINLAAVYQ